MSIHLSFQILNRLLQDRLGELEATITVRREGFCQDMFGDTCFYKDAVHASSSFEAILPTEALTETHDWEMRVANAYDTFQRIALVLEVVKGDLEHHEDGTEGMRQLWRRVEGQVEGVLVNLLTELEMREINGPTLSMAVLPADSLRCLSDSVRRNDRDFIVLRDVLHAASFFSVALNQS